MKNRTIRTKITLWFSISLIAVVTLSFISFMTVSRQVIEKTTLNVLQKAVEENMDEVEFHPEIIYDEQDYDADYYMKYRDGWLEIDDDFLSSINGVSCAVYDMSEGKKEIIYGEDPTAAETKNLAFENKEIHKIEADGTRYYVFDRKVKNQGVENIWIRGVISDEQDAGDITSIAKATMAIMFIILLVAILGGNIVADRMLKPISRITEAASRISRGNDLKQRLDIGDGKDEVHKLADSFNQMVERLDEAFENEQQFTSDVSHELRTPISVIMAQSEFALEHGAAEEDYISALEAVRRQAGKMSKLVNDMLTFTRLGRENSVYSKGKLNLSELAESISEDMALIGEKGISLQSDIAQDVYVSGNRELLSRLIINLIGNAYKYGKENGHIYVLLSEENDAAVLSVEDDGIGISQDDLTKIFNRLYQADSSRSDSGSGLGLFMVREIARYHDGEISVTSRLNEGSRFIFKIKKL